MALPRLLPQSLVARVFALYSAALLLFVGGGLGVFYDYQHTQAIEDAQQSATMLVEVAAQTISDSAVIGDYDTIKRTLDKAILRSQFASATFIDLKEGVLRSENVIPMDHPPPDWLSKRVAAQLYDINRNISAGGTDYVALPMRLRDQPAARLSAQGGGGACRYAQRPLLGRRFNPAVPVTWISS